MDFFFIGTTVGVVGELCLAYAVLSAHSTIERQHSIDKAVLVSLRREKLVALFAVSLIVLGYLFEVHFFGGFDAFVACEEGTGCLLLNSNSAV